MILTGTEAKVPCSCCTIFPANRYLLQQFSSFQNYVVNKMMFSPISKVDLALADLAEWLECRPVAHACGRQLMDASLSHGCFCLPLHLPSTLSKNPLKNYSQVRVNKKNQKSKISGACNKRMCRRHESVGWLRFC